MASQKRKHEEETSGTKKRETCIIHDHGSNCKQFKFIASCTDADDRFQKLRQIASRRLQEPIGSSRRLEEACSLIPDEYLPEHGYHRDCYVHFTKNVGRLQSADPDPQPSTSMTS